LRGSINLPNYPSEKRKLLEKLILRTIQSKGVKEVANW
jgi:hypothetical protein